MDDRARRLHPQRTGAGTLHHEAADKSADHQPDADATADEPGPDADHGAHIARAIHSRTEQPTRIRELIMLEMLCYPIAFALLLLAAVLWPSFPYRDRLAYAGLALWLLPTTVHTLQAH